LKINQPLPPWLDESHKTKPVKSPNQPNDKQPSAWQPPPLVPGKPETHQIKAVFFTGKAEIGLPSDIATVAAKP
jgi:hypothetical protein